MDVALVSCVKLPEPDPDAAPLARALAAEGVDARTVGWDDPSVDWSLPRLTVLRSAWNYPRHHDAFLEWAGRVAQHDRLWNPLSVVRWNSHKSYLLDLASAGVPTVPTLLVAAGSTDSLETLLAGRGWDDVVIKPAVSASSYRTLRVGAANRVPGETHLRALAADGDVLIQPYLLSVEGHGERALIWIDGELTHAVRKTTRWQGDDENVSASSVEIVGEEADLARRALAVVDGPILYGRVDVARGPGGAPVVMELELVEPSLYFSQGPAALDRFVAAILRLLGR